MTMTVSQLRDLLADYDDDAPIMVVHQPTWPLAEVVARVVTADDVLEAADDGDLDEARDDLPDPDDKTVWIVLGGHAYDRSPYGPSWAFDARCGRSTPVDP